MFLAQMHEYKCPCCGGAVEFNSSIQKMKCPYCDTEFEIEEMNSADAVLQEEPQQQDSGWNLAPATEWDASEISGLRAYICKSCGGEIVGDETLAATSCPFCGNPVVMMEQFSGTLKPDMIIPFKLDKEAAKQALKRHYGGKKLLPKVFSDSNHIEEVKGIYVPFWLFDADVDADAQYQATRVRHWSDRKFNYTETSYFQVLRSGSMSFDAVPVDGSQKMPDDLMESLEPYDVRDAVKFQTPYLAGYMAEKYDVPAEESIERANARIQESAKRTLQASVTDFATVIPESGNVRVSSGDAKYALYPVWLLNTTWNNQHYTFAMNGQTGKFVGDLPVDANAAKKMRLKLTGIFAAAAFAISFLIYLL